MKVFGYARDPLCGLAITLYVVNRWVLKPAFDWTFLHWHFNDVLLIPAALPLVLWVQRKLGWRDHDRYPDSKEIALHLLVWAVIAEGLGPLLFDHVTGDWRDVIAYAAGALLARLWWRTR